MATLLFVTAISDTYKETSEEIQKVELKPKDVRVRTMKQLLNESFFHGASMFGDNFIA